jgi:hypothetical protein
MLKTLKLQLKRWLRKPLVSRSFLLKLIFVAVCTIFTAILFESIFPNSCKSWIWFSGWVQALIYVAIFNRD